MTVRLAPHRILPPAVAALLAAVTAACGGSASTSGPADPSRHDAGRVLYDDYCSSCHSEDGSGAVGPALADGRVADRVGGVPELSEVIAEGGDRMPGLKSRLTPEQIEAIAQYVLEAL